MDYDKLLGIIEKYGDANDTIAATDTPASVQSLSPSPHSRPPPHSVWSFAYVYMPFLAEYLRGDVQSIPLTMPCALFFSTQAVMSMPRLACMVYFLAGLCLSD